MERTTKSGSSASFWLRSGLAAVGLFSLVFLAPALLAQDTKDRNLDNYNSVIQDVFSFVMNNYVDEVDPETLYEGALKGMFESLKDPYSVFLNESMMSDLSDTTSGAFGGVGLYISKEDVDAHAPDKPRYIEIVSPIEDTPGWRAGLMPGDLIVRIGDEVTADFATDDAVKRLRGEPNTPVTITVRRGVAEFPVTLTRAVIEVPTVKSAMMPNGVGYLRIIEFSPKTPGRVKESLEGFKAAKCRAVIVDLRNNPGGLLSSVVQISDYFLARGPIVSTKSRNKSEDFTYTANSDLVVPADLPVVVLLNKGSASASEILAGALKDQKRAYLMGETSYGKGSVQQVYPLGKTGFKLTMSRYYTPSDANIDKTGIPPDREVKLPEFSDAQMKQVEKLLIDGTVKQYAGSHPGASKSDIQAFVKTLALKDFDGLEWVIERMTRDEINRTSIAPVYDMDYDIVLKAAIELLDREKTYFSKLFKDTKTVKQIQDELALKEAKDGKTAKGKATAASSTVKGGLPSPAVTDPANKE